MKSIVMLWSLLFLNFVLAGVGLPVNQNKQAYSKEQIQAAAIGGKLLIKGAGIPTYFQLFCNDTTVETLATCDHFSFGKVEEINEKYMVSWKQLGEQAGIVFNRADLNSKKQMVKKIKQYGQKIAFSYKTEAGMDNTFDTVGQIASSGFAIPLVLCFTHECSYLGAVIAFSVAIPLGVATATFAAVTMAPVVVAQLGVNFIHNIGADVQALSMKRRIAKLFRSIAKNDTSVVVPITHKVFRGRNYLY